MILVIGYGFLGRAIYTALKALNYDVKVISRTIYNHQNPDFINAKIDEINKLDSVLKNARTIIHCVHTTVPATSMEDNIYDVNSNIIPFLHLLKQCQKNSVENFIYLSSGGAVYGNPPMNSLIDESFPTNPISSYGITKLTSEKYLLLNKHDFKGNCVILRPSNIYGLGQRTNKPQGLIGHIIQSVINHTPLEIWGDGNSKKDYLFVNDFVNGILKIVENKKKLNQNIFNISSGNLYSINYLIKTIEEKYNNPINIVHRPDKEFDVKNIAINNRLFCETFDWKNTSDFKDFLETF